MEYHIIPFVLLPAIILFILHHFLKNYSKTKLLPPGPKPWPIIGNIHLLGSKPHRSVAELCKKYGPLMTLKLGSITTIVISSPEVAKEMFSKHDLAASSRQIPDAGKIEDHEKHSIVWLPVCAKSRNLRKIIALHLFSNQRLDASQGLRKTKVDELAEFVKGRSQKGLPVDIGKAAATTSLNLLLNTLFSMDFSSYDSSVSEVFKDLAWHLLEEGARPNVSDFFPLLRPLDLQGVRRRQIGYFREMMGFYERIIEERMKDEASVKDDVLSTLLNLVEDEEVTLDDVKHLLLDLFLAGTDTTAVTLEWTMTELLRHPEKLTKVQAEIDQVLGKHQTRSIEEFDIPNLPYVQAIVKEIMRLHPPAPFLIPHKTNSDIQLCGYYVPKNTQVWVNVWSICRDPSIWENPESFMPERFLENEIDYKGRNFELMPFGTGRRMCPGLPLAHRMVHLMLANLIHAFNWKLDHGLNPKDVDMEEKFGMTVQKLQPLQAIPVLR